MKKLMIGLLGLVVVVVAIGVMMTLREPGHLYKSTGDFAGCPPRPSCVSSRATDEEQGIAPFPRLAPTPLALQALMMEIEAMGGEVMLLQGDYLHAVFRTPKMRFHDDLELLVTGEDIQVRSLSRFGYRDFGVNRERVETLRRRYQAAINAG